VPYQPGRTAETAQISENHLLAVLHPGTATAELTPRTITSLADMHHHRLAGDVIDR